MDHAGNLEWYGRIKNKSLFIRAEWDDEASVWAATSDDVPGLATEGETLEILIRKLKIMVPELLEANGQIFEQEVPFELFSRRFEIAHLSSRQGCPRNSEMKTSG